MDEDKLNRLPPDVKKQFLKLALKLSEKKTKSKVHDDFLTFVKHVWPEFIEGKHHKEIANKFNDIANGKIKRIITKAKMTGMGLNWQHCNHTVFFPTWSYEQYYQAIRRFYRFGQKNEVVVDRVISNGQTRVLEAIEQKTKKAVELHKHLTINVNGSFVDNRKEFNKEIIKPNFI